MSFPLKKKAKLYSVSAVNQLIQHYNELKGTCVQIQEGCCGCGDWILYGNNLKTTIIKEVFVNSWVSGHTIRQYNVTPDKYKSYII